jgi:hypothetical protein
LQQRHYPTALDHAARWKYLGARDPAGPAAPLTRVFLRKDGQMIDWQPESTQTEQHPPENLPERLPWVPPRLDSIKFQDAQAGLINVVTDGAGTHS